MEIHLSDTERDMLMDWLRGKGAPPPPVVNKINIPPPTWEMPLEEARMIGVIAQKHHITQEQALLLMIRQCYRYVIEQGGQLT